MPQLIFFRDSRPLFHVRLHSSATKIGRSPQCDIVLETADISREQAVLFQTEGHFFIKNLGQNKLRVNERECENQTLQDEDEIEIGSWRAIFREDFPFMPKLEATEYSSLGEGDTLGISDSPPRASGEIFEIRVEGPKAQVYSMKLNPVPYSVGARDSNDLVLDDPYVSSRHLKIVPRDGRIWVHDTNSTNGTKVNGIRVREAELEPGGVVELGHHRLTLIVQGSDKESQSVAVERFCGLVGTSIAMKKLYGILEKVGPTEGTVLVLGESGSGKELVSRAVHGLSSRSSGPFVAVNCGAISKELIESELFGHEKGAFTGATHRREGAFGLARGGTLFLDEIGELPLDLQPKLLRVLENKTYRRLGGQEELNSDARVVAATHRDLSALVKQKKFREDLFFRLFVLPVLVPALRDHLEDIPLLVDTFLREFSPEGKMKTLSSQALGKLKAHDFPGNIREMRNILMRSVFLSLGDEIQEEEVQFPENLLGSQDSRPDFSGMEKLEEMEKKWILKALKAHDWNKARAAESLGIAKSTLFSKIKVYDLEKNP